jgi:hypothetical protein
MENNKESKFGTSLIAIVTLIVTAIALVPAFLSLNDKKADVFYSAFISQVSIPESLDKNSILQLLQSNGVPGTTLELNLINQGNASANEVKLSITLPSDIIAVWSTPSKSDKPVWVELPEIDTSNDKRKLRFSVKNLAATLPVTFYFGYEQLTEGNPNIQVFYDGTPAAKIESVNLVPEWSKWNVFKLPLYILAGGVCLILIWALIVSLYSNPELRNRVFEELIDAFSVGISPSILNKTLEKLERRLEKEHSDKKS